jgi:hypothetical protein
LDDGVIAINMPQDTNSIDPLKYWVWADYVPPGHHSLIVKSSDNQIYVKKIALGLRSKDIPLRSFT